MLYSIGDIHGNLTALKALYAEILEDIKQNNYQTCKIIFLGDYIDRGPNSRGVIDFLMNLTDNDRIEHIFLLGNHEQMVIDSMDLENEWYRRSSFDMWLRNGGHETLVSYNILPLYNKFYEDFPTGVLNWFKNKCVTHYIHNGVIFVHAQYDTKYDYTSSENIPEITKMTQLWGRSFNILDDHPYFMVCGHTPESRQPHYDTNYICIDTGCGKVDGYPLTALCLPDGNRNPHRPFNLIQVTIHENQVSPHIPHAVVTRCNIG